MKMQTGNFCTQNKYENKRFSQNIRQHECEMGYEMLIRDNGGHHKRTDAETGRGHNRYSC